MAALDDTVEEVLAGFDGGETYDEAEYALRDYPAKEVAVNAARMARALEEGVVPPGSVDAADVSVTPFGSIAATDVQAALEEIVAEAGGGTALVWTGLTFQNSAANLGGGYGDAEYAVDETNDMVYMRGAVNPGTDGHFATLPAEARPSVSRIVSGYMDTGVAAIEITTAGVVDAFSNPTNTVFLDNVRYSL